MGGSSGEGRRRAGGQCYMLVLDLFLQQSELMLLSRLICIVFLERGLFGSKTQYHGLNQQSSHFKPSAWTTGPVILQPLCLCHDRSPVVPGEISQFNLRFLKTVIYSLQIILAISALLPFSQPRPPHVCLFSIPATTSVLCSTKQTWHSIWN